MNPAHFDHVLQDRAAYKFWAREQVRFTDLDALGHVSAVRTNEYFNTARALLFQQAIAEWPQAGCLPVLKLSIIQYEGELHFPNIIDVGIAIEKWGTTSVTFVLGAFTDHCVALNRNVFVFIDAATRKPLAPGDHIRQAIINLAG